MKSCRSAKGGAICQKGRELFRAALRFALEFLRGLTATLLPLLAAVVPLLPQTATDEDYRVFTDSPRLLLTSQRLRLLQRERQRESMRWQQYDGFVSGGAPMPEPGFALALYYQVVRELPRRLVKRPSSGRLALAPTRNETCASLPWFSIGVPRL